MTRDPDNYVNARPDTIYVLKPVGFDGPFKVGCTSNLVGRLRILNGHSPFELEVVCTTTGDMLTERRIHNRLRAAHLRCEWFENGPEIQQLIAEIRDGSFDAAALPAPLGVANMKAGRTGRAWQENA